MVNYELENEDLRLFFSSSFTSILVDCYKNLPSVCRVSLISQSQGYIVLNRPWAFVQWLEQADIKEEYGTHNNLVLVFDELIFPSLFCSFFF